MCIVQRRLFFSFFLFSLSFSLLGLFFFNSTKLPKARFSRASPAVCCSVGVRALAARLNERRGPEQVGKREWLDGVTETNWANKISYNLLAQQKKEKKLDMIN